MSRKTFAFLTGHYLTQFPERGENVGGDDLWLDIEFILDMCLRQLLGN